MSDQKVFGECPTCGQAFAKVQKRICAKCGQSIGRHHKWRIVNSTIQHRFCDNPSAYYSKGRG